MKCCMKEHYKILCYACWHKRYDNFSSNLTDFLLKIDHKIEPESISKCNFVF